MNFVTVRHDFNVVSEKAHLISDRTFTSIVLTDLANDQMAPRPIGAT